MRVVVQRVTNANCVVDGKVISEIKDGYLLLVGFTHGDTLEDVSYLAKKIAKLRIFEDEHQKLNKSIQDLGYEILSISQFTLYGDASKGNRPSFTKALEPQLAKEFYLKLTEELQNTYLIPTYNGIFGEMMDLTFTNNGPVTIILESK